MLCQVCKKREAVIHITEYIGGVKKELHICEECARELGVVGMLREMDIPVDENMVKKLFEVMVQGGMVQGGVVKTGSVEKKERCPVCGLTLEEFKESGFLGCSECYRTFKEEIKPYLLNIHGSIKHVGKKKGEKYVALSPIEKEIKRLKRELEVAVEEERYEDAAKIRDKIKELMDNAKKSNR